MRLKQKLMAHRLILLWYCCNHNIFLKVIFLNLLLDANHDRNFYDLFNYLYNLADLLYLFDYHHFIRNFFDDRHLFLYYYLNWNFNKDRNLHHSLHNYLYWHLSYDWNLDLFLNYDLSLNYHLFL